MMGVQGYSLSGLAGLAGALGDAIPPVSLCKDSSGNVIDCATGQPSGGVIAPGPCDPATMSTGYGCTDNGDGTVTYVATSGPKFNYPQPAPGTGTGTTGSSSGSGAGSSPSPGGTPPQPKPNPTSNVIFYAVLAGIVLLGAASGRRQK